MSKLKHYRIDYFFLFVIFFLLLIGVAMIYSSSFSSIGNIRYARSYEFIKQIIWIILGITVFIWLILIPYYWAISSSVILYILTLLFLIATLVFSDPINGSQSWLRIPGVISFQFSELAKVIFILVLSLYLSTYYQRIHSFLYFLWSVLILLPYVFLIVIQPSWGTALVYIFIWFMMLLVSSPIRYFIFLSLSSFLSFSLLLLFIWQQKTSQITGFFYVLFSSPIWIFSFLLGIILFFSLLCFILYKKFKLLSCYVGTFFSSILAISLGTTYFLILFLKQYQLNRLVSFLLPNENVYGSSWNIIQSITAIGSGGFLGKGFLQGEQGQYSYLPESNTDFIISIIAEEFGFIGVMVVFILLFILLMKILFLAHRQKHFSSYLICIGIFSLFLYHFMVNIGMAIGLLPIMGIPLYLLSYGGSSILTAFCALGLIFSIHRRT